MAGATSLLVQESTLSGNAATANGGGIFVYYGAASLKVVDSTLSGNQSLFDNSVYQYAAGYTGGAAIAVEGKPSSSPPAGFTPGADVIVNSTIFGNNSNGSGGAVQFFQFYGTMIVQDSTITGNTAAMTGTGPYGFDGGSGNTFGGGAFGQTTFYNGASTLS